MRDNIVIETQALAYDKKIGHLGLRKVMKRGDDICCKADITLGLFDLKLRRLVGPHTSVAGGGGA